MSHLNGRPGKQVFEFLNTFAPATIRPDGPPRLPEKKDDYCDLVRMRFSLIDEEFNELVDALGNLDIVEVADALADLVYVIYGAALTIGIDLDACIDEVHRSNMSKLDADGKPIFREDGKILKSDLYEPPNLESVLFGEGD